MEALVLSVAVMVTTCDWLGPSFVLKDQLHVPFTLDVTVPIDAVSVTVPFPSASLKVPLLLAVDPSPTVTDPLKAAMTGGVKRDRVSRHSSFETRPTV